MVPDRKYRSSIQPILSGRTVRGCDNLISIVPETRTGEGGRTPMPSPAAILSAVSECASAVSGVAGDSGLQDTHLTYL